MPSTAKLTILGSGTAVSPSRPSGYLLQYKNRNILIDCGEDMKTRLAKIGIDYFEIDAVFISHFHPDHFNVETLIQNIQVRNYLEKSEKRLDIYGPPETIDRLRKIWDAKHFQGNFDKSLPEFVSLHIKEYDDEKTIDFEGIKITPYFLEHGGMPAAALRFSFGKNVLTYSGDSGMNPHLEMSAIDCDIFLCECNQRPGTENKGHLNPAQVGEIAARCHVKQVVLTHLPGKDSDDFLTNAVRGAGYAGKVTVGHDFLVLQLENA